jgi:hypothetical protein
MFDEYANKMIAYEKLLVFKDLASTCNLKNGKKLVDTIEYYMANVYEKSRKSDGKEAARHIGNFVNSYGCDMKGFVKQMAIEHRTLQQSFTRLCLEWFKSLSENYKNKCFDDRNKASCETAYNIMHMLGDSYYLPMI